MHRWVRRHERAFDYDATYLHELIDASPAAMLKFSRVRGMSEFRRGVARDAWHAARIVAARHEDCGPCTQLVLDMAVVAGVDPAQLRAVAARDFGAMSEDVALGVRFADAVAGPGTTAELRDEIVSRFGRDGLVSLAFAVTGARIFPTLKRALGHAQACHQLRVQGETVTAVRSA